MKRNALPHVVIVGAGFAGLQVAKRLDRSGLVVTVVDRCNHHLFQPLLYQVATAGLSPADITSPIRSLLQDKKNTTVLLAEVIGVDLQQRQVHLKGEDSISYDYLVLATGARHSYFGQDQWEAQAPGLKSITDAINIRRRILLAFEAAEKESDPEKQCAWLNFVIVGAGPTGVELAGSIAELARRVLARDFRHINPQLARVVLLEGGAEILASFPQQLRDKAEASLNHLGVEIFKNSLVTHIDDCGVRIGEQPIAAKTVIWAAGVMASPVGRWLGVETDAQGRVPVRDDLTIAGDDRVFVIGDVARLADASGQPLPGVAPVAMQQGVYVARQLHARIHGKRLTTPFRYLNRGNLATIGRSAAIADLGWLRLSGFVAWVVWMAVHIFFLIGFRNRFLVFFQWAWAYFTFQRGARLITPRES